MKRVDKLMIILTPLLPLVIKVIYLPIDVFVTVNILGCESEGFDANDFNNNIMMPLVLIISLITLVLISRKLTGWRKITYLVMGTFIQVFLSICWRAFLWM